ncbi:hypothetical protein ACQY0O_001885 [Thecaphora frezii]
MPTAFRALLPLLRRYPKRPTTLFASTLATAAARPRRSTLCFSSITNPSSLKLPPAMVPETDFGLALTQPTSAVQSLYDKAEDKSTPAVVRSVDAHFRHTFADADARSKIPVLTPALAQPFLQQQQCSTSSANAKLVRWRCMVQDTGLGTEVFLLSSTDGNRTQCGLFGTELSAAGHSDALHDQHDVDNANLGERTVAYAVSVPGRSGWLRDVWREQPSAAPSSTSTTKPDAVQHDLSSRTASLSLLKEPESPQRIQEVRRRIKAAVDEAKSLGGSGKEPRLVAVSKLHPPSAILAAHRHAGQLHFGENYVQEMVDKAKVLPREIRWHFVGGLQSNKGKLLASVPNLYLLETLDSIKAANVLQKALSSPDAAKRDAPLQVYLQVNTSGEDAKSGQPPILDVDGDVSRPLLDLAIHVVTKCPALRLRGVMTIGAAANSANSAVARTAHSVQDLVSANPDFEKLIATRRNLVSLLRSSSKVAESKAEHVTEAYAHLLKEQGDETGGLELSMGMSADLEVAAMVGSDNVRVGTDCFGRRPGTRDEAIAGMKRELEVGIEAAMAELRSSVREQRTEADGAPEAKAAAAESAPSTLAYQDPLPQKAPIPEEEHIGGLIKFYDVDAAEKLKTTEAIEVVGILDTATLPHSEWQELGSSNPSGTSTAPMVPCLHALYFDPLDLNSADHLAVARTGGGADLSDPEVRSAVIDYFATGLGGDKTAAEVVLLAAIARIHSRRVNMSLGALTVNLSNFPAPPSSSSSSSFSSVPKISRLLANLLPSVVDVSLDLDELNDGRKRFSPRSSGGEVGLEAGRLQLVNGSMIVVNEGAMKEGELKENGMRNIKSLSSVLESHKLPYIFPYSEFEFETDLNALVLSQGKSFLPFDVQCPIQVSEASADGFYGDVGGSDEAGEGRKMERWRRAVVEARSLARAKGFSIPEEVSEHIQREFVDARREEKVGQEDLLRRMALVRLVGISMGQDVLTRETWQRAVELDEKIARRRSATQQQQQPQSSR